jgi:hypothetical protein
MLCKHNFKAGECLGWLTNLCSNFNVKNEIGRCTGRQARLIFSDFKTKGVKSNDKRSSVNVSCQASSAAMCCRSIPTCHVAAAHSRRTVPIAPFSFTRAALPFLFISTADHNDSGRGSQVTQNFEICRKRYDLAECVFV